MGRPTKVCDDSAKKRGRPAKNKKEDLHQRTGFDGNPVGPWRKTVPLITQAVTTVVTGKKSDNKVKPMPEAQLKKLAPNAPPKPYPVFWAKALEGLRAFYPENSAHDRINLEHDKFLCDSLHVVGKTKPVCPVMDEIATAATVIHTLHNPQQPGVFGQKEIKSDDFKKGFISACDSSQPFIEKVNITFEDVNTQEKRVIDARKRLQEALKQFS